MTATEIKALRLRLGLTQVQFAEQIGCSVRAVWFWEHGKRTPTGLYAAQLELLARDAGNDDPKATVRPLAT